MRPRFHTELLLSSGHFAQAFVSSTTNERTREGHVSGHTFAYRQYEGRKNWGHSRRPSSGVVPASETLSPAPFHRVRSERYDCHSSRLITSCACVNAVIAGVSQLRVDRCFGTALARPIPTGLKPAFTDLSLGSALKMLRQRSPPCCFIGLLVNLKIGEPMPYRDKVFGSQSRGREARNGQGGRQLIGL